jgi:hypothetical protein
MQTIPRKVTALGRALSRQLDGADRLLSYLFFSSLFRRAPALARHVAAVADLRHPRDSAVAEVETNAGPMTLRYHGRVDAGARWLLHRLGASAISPCRPHTSDADVELRMIRSHESREFARRGYLILPRWVHHRQALDRRPSRLEERTERSIENGGVRLRFSRAPDDLDQFMSELYEPMLRRRHGERALRTGRALLRWGQQRGGLFLAEVDGQMVAGALGAPSAIRAREVEIWAVGRGPKVRPGAHDAAVYAWVRWARHRGYESVNHLLSLPLLNDGLTRSKLRWGGTLIEAPECQLRMAMRPHIASAAVDGWLRQYVFVTCSSRGLVGVGSEGAAPPSAGLVGMTALDLASFENVARALLLR